MRGLTTWMTRLACGALLCGALLTSGCGPDAELVNSALSHRCNMEKALEKAKTATSPEEKAKAAKEAADYKSLLESVYESGDAEKIRAAVAEKECP